MALGGSRSTYPPPPRPLHTASGLFFTLSFFYCFFVLSGLCILEVYFTRPGTLKSWKLKRIMSGVLLDEAGERLRPRWVWSEGLLLTEESCAPAVG